MRDALLRTLVRLWETEDSDRNTNMGNVDVVVAITYSTKRDELADCTREILRKAIAFKKSCPSAVLAFTNGGNSFPGAAKVEKALKQKMLREYGISDYVCAQDAYNSVQEARGIKMALRFTPARILIFDGEMHSRSVRYIWKKIFPESQIVIRTIPYTYETEPNQELWWLSHGPWVWLLGNIVRQVLIRFRGLDSTAKMHHGGKTFLPSSKK